MRAVQCAAALAGWPAGLAAGLLQFAAVPLSLAPCLVRGCTNSFEVGVHYVFATLCLLLPRGLAVVVTPRFAVGFFVVDLAVTTYVHVTTSEAFGGARLAKHVAYGTINCKTYFVVVLACLQGCEVDALHVLVASLLSWLVLARAPQVQAWLGLPGFGARFVEHRLGHLPRLYEAAHKQHHSGLGFSAKLN